MFGQRSNGTKITPVQRENAIGFELRFLRRFVYVVVAHGAAEMKLRNSPVAGPATRPQCDDVERLPEVLRFGARPKFPPVGRA
jgi:hypothetical protein